MSGVFLPRSFRKFEKGKSGMKTQGIEQVAGRPAIPFKIRGFDSSFATQALLHLHTNASKQHSPAACR